MPVPENGEGGIKGAFAGICGAGLGMCTFRCGFWYWCTGMVRDLEDVLSLRGFIACEIERRPRGIAAALAPTFVSGQ